jgi:hypothetical protein
LTVVCTGRGPERRKKYGKKATFLERERHKVVATATYDLFLFSRERERERERFVMIPPIGF